MASSRPNILILWGDEDPAIAELLKPLGYPTGRFGKNHLGDKDEQAAGGGLH